uniref:phosphoribosylformylglycinamidine cyclo-ligase n=1 Tax=Candidatus Scatomorpha intestinigallinarum TaxID=2840923 RepID=UPI004024F4DA
MRSESASYKAAGVDITAGYRAVELMKKHVQRTERPGVLGGLGGFGGLFLPNLAGMKEPVLVSGTDGVGTKLKIAFLLGKHDTVGIDCVAMCVNDIVCSGAEPLFFLDYIACGRNVPERIAEIVAGVAEGCVQAGAALIGGETAEMPGFYPEDEYDLAGFAVGIVDRERILDSSAMREGDALIALPSSGVHSNGFSLVRRVFEVEGGALERYEPELGRTLGEALLEPTRIYVKPVLALLRSARVSAISHITGGGFYENVPRALAPGFTARIEKAKLKTPPLFSLIARAGEIPERDMYNTFNMGVGMLAAVAAEDADAAVRCLRENGVEAYVCGEVARGEGGVELW